MNRKPIVNILITKGITTMGDIIRSNAEAMRTATPAREAKINPASRNSMSFLRLTTWAFNTTPITSMLAPIKANPKRKYKIKK
ncbi:MAG: hypothetical protein R6U44_09715 [Archaeoglobaceae archaeon]